jgi:homoserine kinase
MDEGLISSAELSCKVVGWEMQWHKIQLQNTSCYIFLSGAGSFILVILPVVTAVSLHTITAQIIIIHT